MKLPKASGKVSKTGQAGVLGQFAPSKMDKKRHARAGHPKGGKQPPAYGAKDPTKY